MKTLTKSEKTAVALGAFFGSLFVALLFGSLFALFVNWVVSLIVVSWTVTVKNWLLTWAMIFIVTVVIKAATKK